MTDRHLIELIDVSKEYAGDVALEHVNLYIKDGEFLTLLGPSGCGKTTMLRLIAGFIQPTSGRIEMDGVDIANVPPYKRKINTVFQKYALFPHLNVFDNIAFGLKIKKMDKALIKEKVEAMLELVNLRGSISSPAASSSASQSRARLSTNRRSFCLTNRSARWI